MKKIFLVPVLTLVFLGLGIGSILASSLVWNDSDNLVSKANALQSQPLEMQELNLDPEIGDTLRISGMRTSTETDLPYGTLEFYDLNTESVVGKITVSLQDGLEGHSKMRFYSHDIVSGDRLGITIGDTGNVGIGMDQADIYPLQVNGATALHGVSDTFGASSQSGLVFGDKNSVSYFTVNRTNNNNLTINSNYQGSWQNRLTITREGNVGIGTVSPAAKLHVAGPTIILGEGEGGVPTTTTIRGAAASGNNIAGADLIFEASNGTGSGGSGDLLFRTAPNNLGTTQTIAFDSASSSNTGASASPGLEWSHTIGAGNNRILVVGVSIAGGSDHTVELITYADLDLTKLATSNNGVNNAKSEIWYLVNPPVGTANVYMVTSSNVRMTAGAHSYSNVDTNNPFGTAVTAIGNSTTASVNVSSAQGELVIDNVAKRDSLETISNHTSQTSRYNISSTYAVTSGNIRGGGSSKSGASNVNMQWTWPSNSRQWAMVAVPLRPANTEVSVMTERLRITNNGRVGIGTSTPQAVLEVSSSTSGFLPPRMTTAQRDAITSPVEGMIIYNLTTHKLNFYNGTAWEALLSQ